MILSEIRRAVRRLRMDPVFTLAAAITIALTLVPLLLATVVRRAILPDVPFPDADRLMAVTRVVEAVEVATSYPKYEALRESSRSIDLAASAMSVLYVRRGERVVRMDVEPVTPNLFQVLGVAPALGRGFREDEREPMGHPVAIISDGFWRRNFGADPRVIGRTVLVNDVPFTIVGVMPRGFTGLRPVQWGWILPQPVDMWVPMAMAPLGLPDRMFTAPSDRARVLASPYMQWINVVGRVRPGFDRRSAESELRALTGQLNARWPPFAGLPPDNLYQVRPLGEASVDPKALRAMDRLRLASILVVLLGAANVATLFLARGADRAAVHGLMSALGMSPAALVRSGLLEAALVGGAGLAGALAVARSGTWAVARLYGGGQSALGLAMDPGRLGFDATALGQAAAAAMMAAFLAGLGPALRAARPNLKALIDDHDPLGTTSGLASLRPRRWRAALVALQVTIAVTLAVPTALLLGTLTKLATVRPGVDVDGVLLAQVDLSSTRYGSSDAVRDFVTRANERLRRLPGVTGLGLASCLPLSGACSTSNVRDAGQRSHGFIATQVATSAGTIESLGIQLLAGRSFAVTDEATAPIAMISASGAAALGGAPLGRRIRVEALGRDVEVIGVVGDVYYRDFTAPPIPTVYLPYLPQQGTIAWALRSSADLEALSGGVREQLSSLENDVELVSLLSMRERTESHTARFRVATVLLGAATSIAIIVGAAGTFGLLTWLVSRGRREIGIRMTLGARPRDIGRLILRTSIPMCVAGLVAGVPGGVAAAWALRDYVFEFGPPDAAIGAAGAALVVVTTFLAAFLPARRATQVEPMTVLRRE
jgi:putative ABC transport system permease protein